MQKPEYKNYECSQELIKQLEKPDVLIGSYIVNGDRKYEKRLDSNKRVYIAELKLGLLDRLWHRMGLGYATCKTMRPNSNANKEEGLRYDIFSPTAPTEYISEVIKQHELMNGSIIMPAGVGKRGVQNLSHFQENNKSNKINGALNSIPEEIILNKSNSITGGEADQYDAEKASKKQLIEFSNSVGEMTANEIENKTIEVTNSEHGILSTYFKSEVLLSDINFQTPKRNSSLGTERYDMRSTFEEPIASDKKLATTDSKLVLSSKLQRLDTQNQTALDTTWTPHKVSITSDFIQKLQTSDIDGNVGSQTRYLPRQ